MQSKMRLTVCRLAVRASIANDRHSVDGAMRTIVHVLTHAAARIERTNRYAATSLDAAAESCARGAITLRSIEMPRGKNFAGYVETQANACQIGLDKMKRLHLKAIGSRREAARIERSARRSPGCLSADSA
jgi:hypothetical protein